MKRLALLISLIVLLACAVSANPTLDPIGAKTVVEGSQLSFTITGSAPDNGTTTFTKDLSVGSLTTENNTTATFTWTPGYNDAGDYTFKITAKDSDSTDDETFTVTVTDAVAELEIDTIEMGSSTQKRTSNVETTFKVENKGNVEITDITLDTVGIDSSYNVEFSPANISSIAAGGSEDVKLTITIPKDHPAINSDFNETAILVGQIRATGSSVAGATTGEGNLNVQARNKLEIDKVNVIVDGSEDTLSSNGKTLDELKPFVELEFEVFAENTYSDSDDIEFDDVEMRILIDDEYFSIDDSDTTSISPRETESLSFDGDELDSEADGKLELFVFVSGEDENGALHGEKWKLYLDVDRETHEIEITSATLTPTTLTCDNRELRVDVDIRNIGKRDEEETAVHIQIPKLNIEEKRDDIDLDVGDESDEVFYIEIPEDAEGKNMDVYVKTYYRTDDSSHSEILKLTVEACEEEEETTDEETTTNDTESITTGTTTASTTGTTTATTTSVPRTRVTSTTSSASDDDSFVVGLLIVAIVVVIALIGVLSFVLLKGKKK